MHRPCQVAGLQVIDKEIVSDAMEIGPFVIRHLKTSSVGVWLPYLSLTVGVKR
jgi:hypothetical protein